MRLSWQESLLLLKLALDTQYPTMRTEHRFRHIATGETKKRLDLRTDDRGSYLAEERTVVETEWRHKVL